MINKTYKMLPLEKQPGAYEIKPRPRVPTISPNAPKTPHRILAISEDGKTATICANMQKKEGGKLSAVDVDITSLGYKSVLVGDILSYDARDTRFEKPVITLRIHQNHQFPKHLLAYDEI